MNLPTLEQMKARVIAQSKVNHFIEECMEAEDDELVAQALHEMLWDSIQFTQHVIHHCDEYEREEAARGN